MPRKLEERDLVSDGFGELWALHTRKFNDLLIACRRHFDGDLDQVLILGLIGERMLSPNRFKGLSYGDFLAGRRGPGSGRFINIQSIADCSGIPRETVRRKVLHLMERGWVAKNADGTLRVTEQAPVDLQEPQQAAFDYMQALMAHLEES